MTTSCITTSTVKPKEKSTAVITLVFTDEDGNTVVPTNTEWQLSDLFGNIINGNTFASNPFTGTIVVLQGDDLQILSTSDNGDRRFAVQGLYTSSAGSNLPLNDEFEFNVCDLVNFS